MPTIRSIASGVSRTCVMARLIAAGKAANAKPSMANTKPSAIRKSDIELAATARADLPRRHYCLGAAGTREAPSSGDPSFILPDGSTK